MQLTFSDLLYLLYFSVLKFRCYATILCHRQRRPTVSLPEHTHLVSEVCRLDNIAEEANFNNPSEQLDTCEKLMICQERTSTQEHKENLVWPFHNILGKWRINDEIAIVGHDWTCFCVPHAQNRFRRTKLRAQVSQDGGMCKWGDFNGHPSNELGRMSQLSLYGAKQPTLVPNTAEFFL